MTATHTDTGKLTANGFATIPQAAKFLAVSRSTVYALMYDGELPSKKIGRSRRIPWNAIREYAARDLVAELEPA